MKNFIFSVMLLSGISTFAMTSEEFFAQVKGKTIVGKSSENIDTTYVFSKDGKTALLKKLAGFKHEFVKMVGDVAVYKGMRGGKPHYDAFQIDGKTVKFTSNDQIGGVKLSEKDNTPEKIAEALKTSTLVFTFK